ncbi:hypothetical protein CDD82_6857 [Ophiocordyceps australis]|uniref:Iron-sulfur cluster assembly factor IBA57 homolog, mitochondrial n=1 Tax=Ophiocordyceps australis TaxID=1399860 RepID=A0A2C5YN14_9HYPO|nr:hypothetical protein CDD82_6857 [Ophiocordyceps australis]
MAMRAMLRPAAVATRPLDLLHQRRPLATWLHPPSAGLVPLASRQVLAISGLDAAKFLQGLVTANVLAPDGLPRPHGFYSALLNAKGRVMHDVFIYPIPTGARLAHVDRLDPGFLVEADASQLRLLEHYIKRYKLRANLTVRPLHADAVSVWQAWDDGADLTSALARTPSALSMPDTRAPGLGHRILQLNGSQAPELHLQHRDEIAYTIRRYLSGVPEGQHEIVREQALPLESNMDLMGAIDFRKGCYVGQELTIRTRHRGVVRKRILPCVLYRDAHPPATLSYHPPPHGAPAAESFPANTSIGRVGKTGRSAGKWLRGTANIGLALCRLEIMTDVVLPGEQAASAYSPGDEFMLDVGQDESPVRIKAFAPAWLRQGLDERLKTA